VTQHEYTLPPWSRCMTAGVFSDAELDWGQRHLKIPDAWKVSRGAGIKVAVLDTGCDVNHPDLVGQVIAERNFTDSPYPDVTDKHRHGTHVSGIIAAKENDRGNVGDAPDLGQNGGGLLIGKVLSDDGSGRMDWIADGIRWAVARGAEIINMSLGSPQYNAGLHKAIKEADEAGVLLIVAAGNSGQDSLPQHPAAVLETISVAAYTERGTIADFSSWGSYVDIAAPGENVLSCWPGGQYMRLSGTSMASPQLAGIAALILSANKAAGRPKLTRRGLRDLLRDTADDLGSPGKDDASGWGLINPSKVVLPLDKPATPQPKLYLGGTVAVGANHPRPLLSIGLPVKEGAN